MSDAVASSTASVILREGEALVRSGRVREAIAYATRENRRLHDSTIEYRLVRWRMQAGDEVAGRSSQPTEPPGGRDLFADVAGVVEVPAAQLNRDVLAAGILHHGCLLVRGLVPEADGERLAEGIDRVFAAAAARGSSPAETRPWYAPVRLRQGDQNLHRLRLQGYRGGGLFAVDSPRLMFELVEVFDHSGVIDVIAAYLGERPTLSAQKTALRRAAPNAGTDWHQDGAFLGSDVRAVNVWLALSHCGEDAPGLDVVPSRLALVETGTRGAKFRWSVGPGVVAAVAEATPVASPIFRPGDALLFDPVFLHRTGVKSGMTKQRWAIESWFFAPSTRPSPYYPVFV